MEKCNNHELSRTLACILAQWMHREVICFNSARWRAEELMRHRVVDRTVLSTDLTRPLATRHH